MFPVEDTAMVAEGQALLTSRYRNLPNTKALLAVFLAACQELEGVFWDVIQERWLANAVAANPTGTVSDQLDKLGALVGQPRIGFSNAAYGQVILLRIKANRSQGRAEDIIQIAVGLEYVGKNGIPQPGQPPVPFTITSPNYLEGYPAGFLVEILDLFTASSAPKTTLVATELLSAAKPLGVRGVLHYSIEVGTNVLQYTSRYGSTGQGVWQSRYGAVGLPGDWAAAVEV